MLWLKKTLLVVILALALFVVLWMALMNRDPINLDLVFVQFEALHAGMTLMLTFVLGILFGLLWGAAWAMLRQRRLQKTQQPPRSSVTSAPAQRSSLDHPL